MRRERAWAAYLQYNCEAGNPALLSEGKGDEVELETWTQLHKTRQCPVPLLQAHYLRSDPRALFPRCRIRAATGRVTL